MNPLADPATEKLLKEIAYWRKTAWDASQKAADLHVELQQLKAELRAYRELLQADINSFDVEIHPQDNVVRLRRGGP